MSSAAAAGTWQAHQMSKLFQIKASGKNRWLSYSPPVVKNRIMPIKLTLRDRYLAMPSVLTIGVMMDTSLRAPLLYSKAPVCSLTLAALASEVGSISCDASRAMRPRRAFAEALFV